MSEFSVGNNVEARVENGKIIYSFLENSDLLKAINSGSLESMEFKK